MKRRDWRVRPIRAVNGRVQIFAVEHRQHDTVWREFAAVHDHGKAMDLAHHLATSSTLVR